MKLNITIEFEQVQGLDYESIQQTINEVVDDEVRRTVRKLVQEELAQQKATMAKHIHEKLHAAAQRLIGETK